MSLIYLTPIKSTGTGAFTPASIPGLQLWLDGSDATTMSPTPSSGSSVSQWNDKSSNGYQAMVIGGSGAIEPIYRPGVLNGNSVLQFSPSGGFAASMQFSALAKVIDPSDPYSIFFVMKFNSFNALNIFTSLAQDTSGLALTPPYFSSTSNKLEFKGPSGSWVSTDASYSAGTSNYNVINYTYNGSGATTIGNFTTDVNGTSQTLSSGTADNGYPNIIGSYSAGGVSSVSFDGYFAEILVYTTALTGGQTNQVLNYFNTKWGV